MTLVVVSVLALAGGVFIRYLQNENGKSENTQPSQTRDQFFETEGEGLVSGKVRESKLKGSPHPSDAKSNERGWNEEKYIWTFPEELQERLEDAYQLELYKLNNPAKTDAEFYSILNCIDYLISSALESLPPTPKEIIDKLDLSPLLDSNIEIVIDYHSRRSLEELDFLLLLNEEELLPPEFNEIRFEEHLNKTQDSSESCINQPVPERYKKENRTVVSAMYLEEKKVIEYYKAFSEAYAWHKKSPNCGNGILDEDELCDYKATDEINNPYGDQCLTLCNVGWTNDGWEGCWGNGLSVCTDNPKITDQYFVDNPKCIPNSNCVEFLRCNDIICPEP